MSRLAMSIFRLLASFGRLFLLLPLGAHAIPVVILTTPGVAAYREAVDGFTAGFGKHVPVVEAVESDTGSTLTKIRELEPEVVVAIGSHATSLARSAKLPVIATMILQAENEPPVVSGNVLGCVRLDVSSSRVLSSLKYLYPGKDRIGVIGFRGQDDRLRSEIQSRADALGLRVEFASCAGARELIEAIAGFRSRVDFVWCLPSRSLYQPATVNALIMASIRHRLPLIGFSESFAKAGALLAYFPSYHEVGVQTADLVRRYQHGRAQQPAEDPRTVRVVLNERVQRLLGVDPPNSRAKEIEVFR